MFEKHSVFVIINYTWQLVVNNEKESTILSKLERADTTKSRRVCCCNCAIKGTKISKSWVNVIGARGKLVL